MLAAAQHAANTLTGTGSKLQSVDFLQAATTSDGAPLVLSFFTATC